MRQVFYIDADEEMISVIGRVRKSSATENVIVAPLRSLILQSIVNLRLLSHDAQKNGKEIIIVTQDSQSRSLCEKAGIRTLAVLDDEYFRTDQSSSHQHTGAFSPASQDTFKQSLPEGQFVQETPGQEKISALKLPRVDALGSMDFFGRDVGLQPAPPQEEQPWPPKQHPMESLLKIPYDTAQQVVVRNKNPQKLTMLNSQRFEEEKLSNQQKSFTPPSLRGATPVRPLFMPTQTPITDTPFGQKKPELVLPITRNVPEKQMVVFDGGKMRAFFIFFGLISVLSVVGVCAYLFLPKAIVHIKPKVMTQKADFEFNGSSKVTEFSIDSKTLPVRILEKDQEVSRSFNATGKTSLADQKARGSVIVYNEYSADPQVLVASTRLLSADGKVFRLLSGVTIPGVTTVSGKIEPGAIEATVIADQSGSDYNVDATSFTIPGFAGSPKATKFYAKSSNGMNGGGESGSDVMSVSDQDVAKAKKEIESKLKDLAFEVVGRDLSSGEKVLSEATDAVIVSASVSPQIGSIANTFEYRVKLHIRTFVFSEDDLKKMISSLFKQQDPVKASRLTSDMVALQYGEPSEDFTAGTIRISVHAEGRLESSLDETQLKSDLLGQNESDLEVLLQKYTQIESISIELWPEFLTSRVPTRADRVNIIIDPSEGK